MSLVRFEPWSLVDRVNRDSQRNWLPAVDIFEEKDRFVVRADVPGVDPNDVEVSMDKGILTVSGERVSEDRSDVDGVSRYERVAGRFLRRFSLPETADADGVKATIANGILDISIPKQAAVQARRITVEAA
ncbi:MAG: Hsp20/alpha crystallin family protein [Woeseiaceae bacterium]